MPYGRNSELPPAVREAYAPECQTVFRSVFNSTMADTGEEGRSFATAHTAAKNCEEARKVADGDVGVKAARPLDFSLSEDGDVMVAFAGLGDPSNQKAEDIDKDGDVSLVGSLPVGQEVPISSYAHASWPERGGRLPVGKGVISERGRLGVLTGRFFTDTTHGRDTYLTVKALADLQEWSFGYRVQKGTKGEWAGKPVNLNQKYSVHEVSPVLIGAGNSTRTLAVKDAEGSLAGSPLEEQYGRLLSDLDAFTDRVKGLIELRGKEGREVSSANRARLAAINEAMDRMAEVQKELRDLLTRTDPERALREGKALEIAYLETEALIQSLLIN